MRNIRNLFNTKPLDYYALQEKRVKDNIERDFRKLRMFSFRSCSITIHRDVLECRVEFIDEHARTRNVILVLSEEVKKYPTNPATALSALPMETISFLYDSLHKKVFLRLAEKQYLPIPLHEPDNHG